MLKILKTKYTTLTVVNFNIKCKIFIFSLSQELRVGTYRHPLDTALHTRYISVYMGCKGDMEHTHIQMGFIPVK
jgi:hypothetical protein